jgi:hypothetical protein
MIRSLVHAHAVRMLLIQPMPTNEPGRLRRSSRLDFLCSKLVACWGAERPEA